MKTTLLPWGAQLGYTGVVTDGMRRLQGHHKPSQSSVSLYSRGDVGGQLEFHKRLVDQVKQGWRPITPQHRGSQAPCKEPNVEVAFFKKSPPPYVWKIVHFYSNTLQMFLQMQHLNPMQMQIPVQHQASEESSDSSSSGSWSDVDDQETQTPGVLALGHHRTTVHAMVKTETHQKQCQIFGCAIENWMWFELDWRQNLHFGNVGFVGGHGSPQPQRAQQTDC